MDKKKKNNIQIIKVVIGLIIVLITLSKIVSNTYELNINRIRIRNEAQTLKDNKNDVGRNIPAKAKINNPEEYNSINLTGSYAYRDYSSGAAAFYSATGIQLYFMDFDFGSEKFENESELRNRLKNEISKLENISNSIVVYSYSTDYDYKDKYYYYGYDEFYYGENVTQYLTADDLQMINFYNKYAYELYEYETRDSQVWIEIGNNLSQGYNTARYKDLKSSSDEIDAGMVGYLIISLVTNLIILPIGVILVISGLRKIKKNNLYNQRLDEAIIEYHKAKATKEILEADLDEIVNEETEELINTYYGEYDEYDEYDEEM